MTYASHEEIVEWAQAERIWEIAKGGARLEVETRTANGEYSDGEGIGTSDINCIAVGLIRFAHGKQDVATAIDGLLAVAGEARHTREARA